MKIRALTAVDDGKNYHPPGDEWDCRKKDAEGLIACGAAEPVIDPEPELEIDPETKADPESETSPELVGEHNG